MEMLSSPVVTYSSPSVRPCGSRTVSAVATRTSQSDLGSAVESAAWVICSGESMFQSPSEYASSQKDWNCCSLIQTSQLNLFPPMCSCRPKNRNGYPEMV